MNPLMDILRQQRGLRTSRSDYNPHKRGLVDEPGGYYGGGPMGGHHAGMDGTSDNDGRIGRDPSNNNTNNTNNNNTTNTTPTFGPIVNQQHNPHDDFGIHRDPPGDGTPDTDETPEKNQWWSNFKENLREDVTNFFSPENIQKGVMGLALGMINPAGYLGLNGLLGMMTNAGIMAAATSPSESELAQGQVDVAQANMDVAHDDGTEQAMRNAQAALSSAQAAEAAAAAAAAEANENDHGGNERPVYLASNPYQGVPYSGYQGSTMDPPPDYSQYVLSHDEKSMADGLEAIGYAPHTAIQYAMHYYNNAEAPVYT